ncbi:hypothetical protein KUTeg_003460 [Tegillarca granosa]|uniref:S phase cyclin A-associated protein in the endoplasmic reticulum n=1 Tax=Tegillarca granosa TaxID=220873 RepID=A0ABQ9FM84_TEGGR|nr:hypothetical protein KUTeg_003460 [Tegillarca granosa]
MSEARRKRGPRMRPDNGDNYHRTASAPLRNSRNNNSQTNHTYKMNHGADRVRKIVQEEGRTARNLVLYNVPVDRRSDTCSPDNAEGHQHHGIRHSRKPPLKDSNLQRYSHTSGKQKTSSVSDDTAMSQKIQQDLIKSPKSDNGSRKPDLRARYWKFLFDNLQRAVDAIYETCEQDESVVECKEVIMMLEQSTRDFQSLIERLKMLRAFESAAKEGDRPPSIAWEVRKMSPGKTTGHGTAPGGSSPSPAQRVLNFTPEKNSEGRTVSQGNSWADKVKGVPPAPVMSPDTSVTPQKMSSPTPVLPTPPPKENGLCTSEADTDGSTTIEDDNEGWETVHHSRGAKPKSRHSPSQRSLENLTGVGKNSGKSLKRTFSDPHAAGFRRSQRNTKSLPSQKSSPPNNYPYSGGMRQRTDSKDSEKENKPGVNSEIQGSAYPAVTRSTSLPVTASPTVVKSRSSISNAWGPTRNVNNGSTTSTQQQKTQKNLYSSSVISHRGISSPKPNDQENVLKIETVKDGNDKSIVISQEYSENNIQKRECDIQEESGVDSCDIDIVEDGIEEKELNNALVSAMDEEDDLTNQLEQEQEQALESAIQEEETWLKELAREENTQIEVETETETESELGNTMSSLESSQPGTLDWDAMLAQYDAECENNEGKKTWSEMIEEAETRTPGHGVHMHEKLSSPSRKRSPTESKKRHEEKQAKAQELREKLMQMKSERLRELSKKVEEVRSWKEELLRQRKETIESKMMRAEEKRQLQLKLKAQKAHEEEAKANEIAFINTLETQMKRHDIMSKHQESEARLQDIQEERLRKHEEKLAKEAAVEERRKALEAERKARLKEMEEKRKLRNARFEQQQIEKEKERAETLRIREKERDERLAALNAQQQAHIQELQKKIQQKQDESTQRHQEVLQQIREKAFEMSVLRHSTEDHNEAPNITPYDQKKLCTICNVLIPSEVHLLSHLRGKKHQQALHDNNSGKVMAKQDIETFNLKHIVDAPVNSTHPKIVSEKERHKSMKKRCKKLRQRMTTRGMEYENSLSGKQQTTDSEHKAKLQKLVRDINKYLQSQDTGPWTQNKVSALDRSLGEISRILDKKSAADQTSLRILGGLTTLSRILQVIDTTSLASPQVIPAKSLVLTCNVFKQACKGCYDNCHYLMFSNKIGIIIELLIYRLLILLPDEQSRPGSASSGSQQTSSVNSSSGKLPYDTMAVSLLQLLATILSCLAKYNPAINCSEASVERMTGTGDAFTSRGNDVIR